MEENENVNFKYTNNDIKKVKYIQEEALKIYGKYDLEKSMLWMTEEFGEVIQAIRKKKSKEEIIGEIGDLLAWVLCISNILDIDISDCITGTFKKEIGRQLRVYKKIKYSDNIEGLEVL